ncbi:MAG: TfoX/Sxy family DNA transformation protein [Planctomycetota bacterium]|jgi:DNA transformation protein
MGEPKGARLYVNLGSSQTKRRLKGFGHGVRQIQSAGRNRAVIVHTATGRHLLELEAKFADVGCAADEAALDQPPSNLRNLGPASAAWLVDAGMRSISDIRRAGPVGAFQLVRRKHPEVSLNLFWAIIAGLEDRDWRDLTESEKERWLAELSCG